MKSLDVLIPVFNEESCIGETIKRLLQLKETLKNELEVSLIFINDGSSDNSLEILNNAAKENSSIKIINFSRNFGHQIALTAGLDYTKADYTAVIDADLQDPPELIMNMYELSKDGYDIVYGKRRIRKKESFLKKVTAHGFYRFINKISSVKIPNDTGDFRLMKKCAVDELKKLREKHRFIRGMISWTGFKSIPFYYDRDGRFSGETKYSFLKMYNFAMDAIYSFSLKPLRTAGVLSVFLFITAAVLAFYMCIEKFILQNELSIAFPIILVLLILFSLNIFVLGIAGEYIGRIFAEVQNRPLYIIKDTVNF